jgi:ribokinase
MVDVLVPNEGEAELLSGQDVSDLTSAEVATDRLLKLGVGTVIVTLGERGALLAGKGSVQRFPAYDVVPVDTTAAGDAFLGGFAVAVGEGKPLVEAVRWGNAAGALATTRMGAQPSLPSRKALENTLREDRTKA